MSQEEIESAVIARLTIAEKVLARAQRNLPMSSKYDSLGIANERGAITELLEEVKKAAGVSTPN